MFKTQVEQASGFTAKFWTFYGIISVVNKSTDHEEMRLKPLHLIWINYVTKKAYTKILFSFNHR